MKEKLEQIGRRKLLNYNNANLIRMKNETTYVYYARLESFNRVFYKIGCAKDVEVRLKRIEEENRGCKVSLIDAVAYSGSFEAYEHESMIKGVYKAEALHGKPKGYHMFKTCLREIFIRDVLELDKV